jgi:hypothetical protein
MNGWHYAWVDALPRDVYDVLVEQLNAPPKDPE